MTNKEKSELKEKALALARKRKYPEQWLHLITDAEESWDYDNLKDFLKTPDSFDVSSFVFLMTYD